MAKIVGNTTATPYPRPDWNQTDENKADYIKNKPDISGEIDTKIAGLIDSAPEALNTLNELAEALNNDENFATTVATQLGNKVDKIEGKGLSTNDFTNEDKQQIQTNKNSLYKQTQIPVKIDDCSGLLTDVSTTEHTINIQVTNLPSEHNYYSLLVVYYYLINIDGVEEWTDVDIVGFNFTSSFPEAVFNLDVSSRGYERIGLYLEDTDRDGDYQDTHNYSQGIINVEYNKDVTVSKIDSLEENISNLAPIATSGSYNDLSDIPDLATKVDKEEGKSLSTNDFTDEYIGKINNLENECSSIFMKTIATSKNGRSVSVADGLVGSTNIKIAVDNIVDNNFPKADGYKILIEEYSPEWGTGEILKVIYNAEGTHNVVFTSSPFDYDIGIYVCVTGYYTDNGEDVGECSDITCDLSVEYERSTLKGKVKALNNTVAELSEDVIMANINLNKKADKGEVIDLLYPTPITHIPTTLEASQKYNFGEVAELNLAFPTDANDGDVIYLTFKSGAVATNLTIDTTNTCDIEVIPETNTGYEIFGMFNGSIWIINYSEYTVSEV